MTAAPAQCRSCGSAPLERILSLGSLPLANALLSEAQLDQAEPMYPLDLVVCPTCTLVQITVTVPPEELFRDYVYFSSYADTAIENARALVDRLVTARGLGPGSLAMEVASNDGYLLQHYLRHGVPALGIEPARNIARVAVEHGIRTITEFFGVPLAERLRADGEMADVLHANNVLAHVADLNGFVAGLELVLKARGVAVVEVPYVADLIAGTEFDTIYHEHLCYFSLTALTRLFERHGLMIEDVEHLPVHGGSLRLFVVKADGKRIPAPSVELLIRQEAALRMDGLANYRAFAVRVGTLRRELCACLASLKAAGAHIAAYGASAKGTTLLNHFGIGRETLDFVVDRSPAKQGRFTPGTHLPIRSPETLLREMPDYVLLLAWNLVDEVLEQQAEYRRRGGRFVIPMPDPKIV
ncbi:MAG: methyltransferase [Acidobacteria bacterium 21-70-11]|nr:MAG: methyltransferase [Acidobacteria bacterium 21-70-11]HQT93681.1 class I SAM-dependent methyltransferase [Thermoanaerobaculaceae bacterium]HQU32730.1 class I SAM-dependent methyltransferase [Thermoanaerobaculaceae bacterium]